MNNLKYICNVIITAGEKAKKRPWVVDDKGGIFQTEKEVYDFNDGGVLIGRSYSNMIASVPYYAVEDRNYIVLSANNADRLARAFLVLEEATNKIFEHGKGRPDLGPSFRSEHNYQAGIAIEALTQVEKILGGGE